MQTYLMAACAQVRKEISVFSREYLPVFLARSPGDILSEMAGIPPEENFFADSILTKPTPPPLAVWQRALENLALTLPGGKTCLNLKALHPKSYDVFCSEPYWDEFLPQTQSPCFRVVNDTLAWKMSRTRCCSFDSFVPQLINMAIPDMNNADSWLPQAKRALMQLRPDRSDLFNTLCYVLPYIAFFDAAFAKLALDAATWRIAIESDASMSAERRQLALERLGCGMLPYVLNNALLHVFSGMAGNHFLAIGDMLDHPSIYGRYTRLMPRYLFAILLGKACVLRQLLDSSE